MSSKKHDSVFDDVLSNFDDATNAPGTAQSKSGSRFLKRSTAIGDRLTGEREEKVLQWVDPATCRMWARHNRDYALLNEDNCRDLIDGIRAQGRQEFPAIVRRLTGEGPAYEVICGARRHFAVSWLRDNNYLQFKYLVEVRDLSDEEAFRLSDIENRDRDDISDFERARDYAGAIRLYYGGKQKAMAARLEVSEGWLSRYLTLAKLPDEVVSAFPSIRDLRELHARTIKPLLANPKDRETVLAEARSIASEQVRAREGQGALVEPAQVVARLKGAARVPKPKSPVRRFCRASEKTGIIARRSGRKTILEVPEHLSRASAEAAFEMFLDDRFGKK
jgi:ParB family transcriptional regulator, chromosome partitioning protein